MSIKRTRNTPVSVKLASRTLRTTTALLLLATGTSALAQSSNLSVYGRLNMSIEHYWSENQAGQSVSQNALGSWGSRLGFQGSENLGDNLKAIFQIESGIRADDGRAFFAGRDTFVGLTGPLGTLKLGHLLPVYDDVSLPFYHLPAAGSHNPIALWANCSGRAGLQEGCFNDYLSKAIRYDTPEQAGISASVTLARPNSPAEGQHDGVVRVIGGQYQTDQTYIGIAHHRNDGIRAAGLQDDAITLSASFTTGNWYLGGAYERLKYQIASGGHLTRDYFGAMGRYRSGSHVVWANYNLAARGRGNAAAGSSVNAISNREHSGASMITLGYQYKFSRTAWVHTYLNQIRNDKNGIYNVAGSPFNAAGSGKNITIFGLGMEKRF